MAGVAGHVSAADRTWVGNGGDVNWTTPGNWNGEASAPADGDALLFGGTSKLANSNDFTGATFAGLTFSSGAGAFTLAGSSLTLGGNITNWSANTQTIKLPMTLSGTRDINASNGAVTVSGSLSGAGGLNACGFKDLTLAASNSYEGVTTVTQGALAITHGDALGSTNANTVVVNSARGQLKLSGNITVAEPLSLSGQRPDYGATILSSSGSTP